MYLHTYAFYIRVRFCHSDVRQNGEALQRNAVIYQYDP